MALKKLQNFLYFDFNRFAKGKRFMSIGQKEWKDFKTNDVLGTKVEVVIIQDKTDYEVQNGELVTNLYEKLVFKIPMNIEVPLNVEIIPKGVNATVYGDYRNQLSCTVDEIEVITK